MPTVSCRLKSYIQPFERDLALRELDAVATTIPRRIDCEKGVKFSVTTTKSVSALADMLTYWECVSRGSECSITRQSLRESTVNVVRNGIDLNTLWHSLPFQENSVPLPNRRCLRYGTHGIHEYRGRFFPQLVRSLINISGAPSNGIVADPMSGSGTTLIEAALSGYCALGLDMNPLSVFMAKAKCDLLCSDPAKLTTAYQEVRRILLEPEHHGQRELTYVPKLSEPDQDYLYKWFSEDALMSLDEIASTIGTVRYLPARELMWIGFSNILRMVSWQKTDDLRVRKDIRLDIEIDPKHEFLQELARSIRAVLAFLYQEPLSHLPTSSIQAGDARYCEQFWSQYKGDVDVVITSPPYATALPYLDTDRLSLCFLNLLSRPEHRKHDHQMIGNREITERLRRSYRDRLDIDGDLLPPSVSRLVGRIESLNAGTNIGFRKRNLPALLVKYFFDMREAFQGMFSILKPGANAFVVVGNSHTFAGGKRVDIETTGLLEEIAVALGFETQSAIPMEMLVSRDIFKKNTMTTEKILRLKKPDYM